MSEENTVCLSRFFTWEIENFDPTKMKRSIDFDYKNSSPKGLFGYYHLPVIRNFDRYNDLERVAKLKIKLWQKTDDLDAEFVVDITPHDISYYSYFFLYENEIGRNYEDDNDLINGKYSKVLFCIDVGVPDSNDPPVSLVDKLKNMYKKDPASKFIIKCQTESFEALKPVLAACSPVFEAMLASGMKESQGNSMEITDFEPKVIQKMIEFCEDDTIGDYEGLEEEVFKIANKYQLQELMNDAVNTMAKTTTNENRTDRYHMLANLSSKEEFKKWWSKFKL